MRRDKKMARAVRQFVGDRLDAVAAILRNEVFNPIPVVAEEDQVFCATDNQPVDLDDLGALQLAWRGPELRKGEIRLSAGEPDVGNDTDS